MLSRARNLSFGRCAANINGKHVVGDRRMISAYDFAPLGVKADHLIHNQPTVGKAGKRAQVNMGGIKVV